MSAFWPQAAPHCMSASRTRGGGPHLKVQHPQREEYQKDAFTDEDVRNWVDHSEDNLVLCDVHHRAKFLGIHEVSYPIWAPMNLLRNDFEDYVRQQIEAAKPAKKANGKEAATNTSPQPKAS
jgi:hypothetical protein